MLNFSCHPANLLTHAAPMLVNFSVEQWICSGKYCESATPPFLKKLQIINQNVNEAMYIPVLSESAYFAL